MSKYKLTDGDASPIIINDSSSTGEKGKGLSIAHPSLLHGNGFKVLERGFEVDSVGPQGDPPPPGIALVAPWILFLNRGPGGGPIVTLSSSDNKTVNIQLDEVDFDITVFDHTDGVTHHFHPALTSHDYDLVSVSLLNGIKPGASVDNRVVVPGGGAQVNFKRHNP